MPSTGRYWNPTMPKLRNLAARERKLKKRREGMIVNGSKLKLTVDMLGRRAREAKAWLGKR